MIAQRAGRDDDASVLGVIQPLQHAALMHVRIVRHFDEVADGGDRKAVCPGLPHDVGTRVLARPVLDQTVRFGHVCNPVLIGCKPGIGREEVGDDSAPDVANGHSL